MADKGKVLQKISKSQVNVFKIKNRRGYAAVCFDNLTEGNTVEIALERMNKVLKRMGYTIE
ncbi:MAG TPA: hypothetical protein PKY78_01420 [Candidatus Omnitrophota bacterium]|nr:hypothetical protein [Candidatus Omnitrophota bacterium]HPS19640.1 hypothetical protein [Candidatus Omnitrophota bacterium]